MINKILIIIDKQPVLNDKIIERQSDINNTELNTEDSRQNDGSYEDNDLPVIYQRESF